MVLPIRVNNKALMKRVIIVLCYLLPYITYGQQLKIKGCFIDAENDIKYCIASDSATYDDLFGDSYRLFLLMETRSDSILDRYYLDINRSPDFPYDLKPDFLNTYNKVIIQGYAAFYIYSVAEKKISLQITPDYTDCSFSDGQGMMINDLKIKEDGLVLELNVRECGLHKFDIQNLEDIKEIE